MVKYPVLYIFNFNNQNFLTACKRLNCSIESILNQVDEILILNATSNDLKLFIPESNKITIINKEYKGYHNKPLLINYMVRNYLYYYDYYIASDIDLVYPENYVEKLTSYIDKQSVRVIPKNQVIPFEMYSSDYNKLLEISLNHRQHPTGESRGNGLIHVESFLKIKGYNEYYLGYAPEDLSFNVRIEELGNKIIFDKDLIHIHLWHNPINREYEKENNKLWEKEQKQIEKGKLVFNENWGEY